MDITGRISFVSARSESCGKVMFLHLSVILFTGGGVSLQDGGLCQWDRPPYGNVRAVRFLLECILVSDAFLNLMTFYKQMHMGIIAVVFVKWPRWFSSWGENSSCNVKFPQKQIHPLTVGTQAHPSPFHRHFFVWHNRIMARCVFTSSGESMRSRDKHGEITSETNMSNETFGGSKRAARDAR